MTRPELRKTNVIPIQVPFRGMKREEGVSTSREVSSKNESTDEHPYRMTISLNVLNHLGLGLYSNAPAVLAEAVANAWDADTQLVKVEIDAAAKQIVIADDGHGMTKAEVNDRFLNVGYARRNDPGGSVTPKFNRPVMGRKGIGKLSLFSIADEVEVHTVRNGQTSAFRMTVEEIRKHIEEGEGGGIYFPEPIEPAVGDLTHGTCIVVREPRKSLHNAGSALRKRLARRFSIIGPQQNFEVYLDGKPITLEDRDYFHMMEYLWWYGAESKALVAHCSNLRKDDERSGDIEGGYSVRGWIGTVDKSTRLKDGDESLNRITITARGKLVHEDVLESFTEGGLYSKYLMGEIHADFLDVDDMEDIATSSRQAVKEDDPRFVALKDFVRKELKNIESAWSALREKQGVDDALQVPAIKAWFESLNKPKRKKAESLFGKINKMTVGEHEKARLFKHAVLAFESLRYKENLEALERITPENLESLGAVVSDLDDIEATLYHQILSERVAVINALREKVDENALEKVIQEHLYKHLWLLDPSWERATETHMEQTVAKAFGEIDAKLDAEEKKGRLDIRYCRTSGVHVIVELKRADRVVSRAEIVAQVDKYRNALRKVLDQAGRADEPIEVVVLVGKPLKEWATLTGRQETDKMLSAISVRVMTYQELLDRAYQDYSAFLKKRDDLGHLRDVIEHLESEELKTASE